MDLKDELVRLRRILHAAPEVGLDLPRTQDVVLASLDSLPLEVSLGRSSSGVTGVLRGGRPGPTVLLRADMDALPMTEKTGLSFAANGPAMHACGHDLHTAMLLGAAHLLAEDREDLVGDVVFMFQPGEEGYDGAGHMLAEGLLEASGTPPVAAYALHVISAVLPSGVVATRPGSLMSAADVLKVKVLGRGGHGSSPHRAADPVQALCAMATALQVFITREIDVFDPAVVTVGRISGGTAHNIIPDTAELEATVRSFSAATRDRLVARLPAVCRSVAAAHGLDVDVELETLYPVTVNDADAAQTALGIAAELFGPERTLELPNPVTGSEDFSRVLQAVPGAMLFLGATPAGRDPADAPYNHAPEADFDEAVLVDGARLYAELARRRLVSTG
ncbi:MAG: M20 family metallopeptidase [Actinomycetota bacterium]|nr:M20 family metallopeptidase [Actinomycetota bacterium]